MKDQVTLKKLKFHKGHDGDGFNADLYIRGKRVATVYDGAYGGGFEYHICRDKDGDFERNKVLFQELKDHIKTLPNIKSAFFDDGLEMDMDLFIDELIQDIEKEKNKKKLDKLMVNSICYGVPNSGSYRYMTFKLPLSEIKLKYSGTLKARVLEIQSKLKKGEVIFNTNL